MHLEDVQYSLKASEFRVLRVVGDREVNPGRKLLSVAKIVELLAQRRKVVPGQEYDADKVRQVVSKLVQLSFVANRGNKIECFETGRKLVENVMKSKIPELSRHRAWCSPEKLTESA